MEKFTIFGSHAQEEALEEYLFGRLPDFQTAQLEEHLLICEPCRQLLTQTADYILLMKKALGRPARRRRYALLRAPLTTILAAGGLAAALAVTIPHSLPQFDRPAIETVQLTAFRGGDASLARVRAGAAIDAVVDGSNLDESSRLRVQVVDASGDPVWSGAAQASARIEVKIGARLRRGIYWVRLYSPASELLREFGLRVE